jgi:hypothetical protein
MAGGIAAFSVWGRKEFGNQFTIPMTAWARVGVTETKRERSHFHLSDAESTRQLILQAGFQQCISWYSVRSFSLFNHKIKNSLLKRWTNSETKFVLLM